MSILREVLSVSWRRSLAFFARCREAAAVAAAVLLLAGLLNKANYWLVLIPPVLFVCLFLGYLPMAIIETVRNHERRLEAELQEKDRALELSNRENKELKKLQKEGLAASGEQLLNIQLRLNEVRRLHHDNYAGQIKATEEAKSEQLVCATALTLEKYWGQAVVARFMSARIIPLPLLQPGEAFYPKLDFLRSHVRYLEGYRDELKEIISDLGRSALAGN